MGNCSGKANAGEEDELDHKVDFAGGNVHVITSRESWDAKLSEASKDGRTVFTIATLRLGSSHEKKNPLEVQFGSHSLRSYLPPVEPHRWKQWSPFTWLLSMGKTFSTYKGTSYFRSGPIVSTVVKQGRLSDLVVVNFSASWCGPCRMIAPFYTELSEKYPALTFLTIDVDELSEFSSSWDIRATPTFFFLKDKKQVDKLLGANKPELEKKVIAFADSAVQCSQ